MINLRCRCDCAFVGGAQYLAVEIPWLAEEAVLLVGAVGAAVLVVAAVRSRVTGSISGTGEFVLLTGGTVQLVPAIGAVPVAVAALLLGITAPVPATGNLPRQAEAIHLQNTGTTSEHFTQNRSRPRPLRGTHLVGDVEPSSCIDLVSVEVDSELTGR